MCDRDPKSYDPTTTLVVIAIIIALALLGEGCARPEPIIIEQTCQFAELNPKPKLPPVKFIPPDKGCPFFRCLDEESAVSLKEREIRLRQDSNYARQVYEETKDRCSK